MSVLQTNRFEMNLAVITACIPGLKHFLSELQGGLTQLDIRSHIKLEHAGIVFEKRARRTSAVEA